MAHVLKIIPKGFRIDKRVQNLSCMENCSKSIQQRIEQAAKVKQELQADIFERENKIRQNTDAAKNI